MDDTQGPRSEHDSAIKNQLVGAVVAGATVSEAVGLSAYSTALSALDGHFDDKALL